MAGPPRPVYATLLVGAVLLASGCVAGVPPGETGPADTPAAATAGATNCVDGVSFWGLSGPHPERRWSTDRVRIGYTLPPNASVFFVVYENGTVLGVARAANRNADYAIAADGDSIELDARLSGSHQIRVVAVADTNRNGAFDPEADLPCRRNGSVVQAGPRTIDFSEFATNGTVPRR